MFSPGGEAEDVGPAVQRRPFLFEKFVMLEPADDPAEVPRIKAELDVDDTGRGGLVVLDLVEHPRLGEGEGAVEHRLVDRSYDSGVVSVETADLFRKLFRNVLHLFCPPFDDSFSL